MASDGNPSSSVSRRLTNHLVGPWPPLPELSAYPSVGAPRSYVDQGALDVGTLRAATATMGYKHRCLDLNDARAQITLPTFMR